MAAEYSEVLSGLCYVRMTKSDQEASIYTLSEVVSRDKALIGSQALLRDLMTSSPPSVKLKYKYEHVAGDKGSFHAWAAKG